MKSYHHTQQLLATRQAVLAALTWEPQTIAAIAKACGHLPAAVSRHLTGLASIGLARRGSILGIEGAGWQRDSVLEVSAAPADPIVAWLEERGLIQTVRDAAASAGATVEEVCGKARTARIAQARHDAWTALEGIGMRRIEIARAFRVDHSTVGAGIAQADRRRMAREAAE